MSIVRRYCVSRYGIEEKDFIAEIKRDPEIRDEFNSNCWNNKGERWLNLDSDGFFNFYFNDGSDKRTLRILGCRYIEYETEDVDP